MITIKKDMQELHSHLESLLNKKLTQKVLDELTAQFLATKNSNGSGSRTTAYYDDNRNLVAVYCYYHKQWELVDHIEYGKKAGTKTGLNTMCKEGVSMWTKANRDKTKHKDVLLKQFSASEITADEFKEAIDKLEIPLAVEPHSDEEHSFASVELLEQYLANPTDDAE